MNEEIHRELLFHDDAEVEIRSADDDSHRQIEDLRYFGNGDFDLVIVSPNEAEAVTPAVREIYQKGIPVIVFDRALTDSSYTAYIDLDNVQIGREAAQYAGAAMKHKRGSVVELRGLAGSTPAEERHRGFAAVMDTMSGIDFIGTFSGDWNAASARRLTDSLLTLHPDIGAIYAHNDVMAIAAAQVAQARNRPDIMIIGTDAALKLGIKAVADSVIDVTFRYPTEGDRVIRTAMQILHGDKPERVQHIPALSYIDRSNAASHIRLNEMIEEKAHQLEQMNSMYSLAKKQQQTQRIIVYSVSTATFFLLVAIIVLLYFLRLKYRYQKILAEKNAVLIKEKEKSELLYSRLEEATRSKLAFFTNVSHDLRTPLTLIADPIAKIAAEDYLHPADRKLMGIVNRNVRILRRMIDQILDFRRYENGMMPLTLRETDIISLFSRWCSDFTEYARSRDIDFVVDLPAGQPHNPSAAIDVEKMQSVFFNLLSNAFKYTEAKGRVKVSAKIDSEHLSLRICDTGSGMTPEETEQIFDRFYQADRPRPKGSGIGLSLTKAYVEMMEGHISVKSEKGKGSCFSVIIPVKHSEIAYSGNVQTFDLNIMPASESIYTIDPTNEAPCQELRESEEKPLLLVIDDNSDIRSLVRLIVRNEYEVIEAAEGKEGLRLALKYQPDLIICDIMMPVMDGLEVTRRLKQERLTCHIPILILTACTLDEQRLRSYDSGADGFLSKPFTQVMLLSRSAALIRNRKRIYDLLPDEFSPLRAHRQMQNDPHFTLDNDFYQDFIRIVRDRYQDENLTIADIAAKFGIGATQLTRKIKALTGYTPVEIIRELRLSEARRKLLVTTDTVAEIAYSTGFSSSQYFARCFREAYGMTPTEMRNSLKK